MRRPSQLRRRAYENLGQQLRQYWRREMEQHESLARDNNGRLRIQSSHAATYWQRNRAGTYWPEVIPVHCLIRCNSEKKISERISSDVLSLSYLSESRSNKDMVAEDTLTKTYHFCQVMFRCWLPGGFYGSRELVAFDDNVAQSVCLRTTLESTSTMTSSTAPSSPRTTVRPTSSPLPFIDRMNHSRSKVSLISGALIWLLGVSMMITLD